MNKTILFLILTLLPLSLCAQEYQDVVYLKNGSVIKGFYNELYPGDSLRMNTLDGGKFICAWTDIARIAKEKRTMYLVSTQDEEEWENRTWRPQGFKGILEYGQAMNASNKGVIFNSLFVTLGYQFNRHVFIGAGAGLEQVRYEDNNIQLSFKHKNIPIYGDLQFTILRKRISPVLDCRTGYTVNGFKGLYFNPSLGVDLGVSPRFGGYIAIGYFLQKYKEEGISKQMENISVHLGIHF